MKKHAHRLVSTSLAAVISTFVCLIAISAPVSKAQAQNAPKLIDVYGKWEAYPYSEEGQKVCYMWQSANFGQR